MTFLLRVLLYPLAVVYDAITRVRNRLYDQGTKPATTFDIPIISVGNLAVGGTGKTPMIEYLIRLLQTHTKVATLSRGYGRRTTGIRIAGQSDNADTLGDEPYQIHLKFPDVTVAVGEDRVYAVPLLLDQSPQTGVILLDDAFQHRRIKPAFQILLTEYARPFTSDYLLPSGRLREARTGATRADVVVVTKCPPSISPDEQARMRTSIARYSNAPVYFSSIRYGQPVAFGNHNAAIRQKILLVTGIANPEPLITYLAGKFEIIDHFDYRDHYRYSEKDLEKIKSLVKEDVSVLTTEKDRVKLDGLLENVGFRLPLFYLPIEMVFLKNGEEFDALVWRTVGSSQSQVTHGDTENM